jgi:L-arabinose isomerase
MNKKQELWFVTGSQHLYSEFHGSAALIASAALRGLP